jgi:glycerol-3-phosphate acyltransferase PlsY
LIVVILMGAYLIGSIPFSYLVARRRGVDVRQVGSGNVGATNVMRSAGIGAGLLAFALDFAKGSTATMLARHFARAGRADQVMLVAGAAATAAVLGHVFPLWLGFRGGKGVATGAGVFLPLAPEATLIAIALFAIVLALSRYVSVGSMVGATSLAAFTFVRPAEPAVSVSAVIVATLIVIKHRENIGRLRRGEERRIGAPRAEGRAS